MARVVVAHLPDDALVEQRRAERLDRVGAAGLALRCNLPVELYDIVALDGGDLQLAECGQDPIAGERLIFSLRTQRSAGQSLSLESADEIGDGRSGPALIDL